MAASEALQVYITPEDAARLDEWGQRLGQGRSALARMILRLALRSGEPFSFFQSASPKESNGH